MERNVCQSGVKAVLILGILVVAYAAAVLFRRLIVPLLQKISARTKAVWDDHLFSDRVMHRAARLIPPLIWYVLLRAGFLRHARFAERAAQGLPDLPDRRRPATRRGVPRYALRDLRPHETLRNRPLKGVYQMIKLLAVCVGAILIVSILIGRTPRPYSRDWALRRPSSADFPDSILGWSPACSSRPTTCCVPGTGSRWPNTAPTAM